MTSAAARFSASASERTNGVRADRPQALVEQKGSGAGFPMDFVRDNQRWRGGEDKAVVPCRNCRLEQIERARDIDVDKSGRGITRDIRLMERPGMDHRLDAVVR